MLTKDHKKQAPKLGIGMVARAHVYFLLHVFMSAVLGLFVFVCYFHVRVCMYACNVCNVCMHVMHAMYACMHVMPVLYVM